MLEGVISLFMNTTGHIVAPVGEAMGYGRREKRSRSDSGRQKAYSRTPYADSWWPRPEAEVYFVARHCHNATEHKRYILLGTLTWKMWLCGKSYDKIGSSYQFYQHNGGAGGDSDSTLILLRKLALYTKSQ